MRAGWLKSRPTGGFQEVRPGLEYSSTGSPETTNRQGNSPPDEEIVPHDLIMSWRGACTCGWQGELWQRVLTPEEADFASRREYCPLGGGAYVSERVEDAVQDEWMIHIAPSEAILGVEAAAREYRQAGHRLDKTVAAAKAAGASWTDIGHAAGISRQAAHERWADK